MSKHTAFSDYSHQKIAIIGYGVTGRACTEYLLNKQALITVFDKNTDLLEPHHSVNFEHLNDDIDLSYFELVVVSPGINLNASFLKSAQSHNIEIIGDIELFARASNSRIIAVTGSNGKSTVVDMLYKVMKACGCDVGLGGNFGTGALDLLANNHEYVILELSSFQLESTYSLSCLVSCILNVTPDHLDRHGSMDAYSKAKQQIYSSAKHIIFNRDDKNTYVSYGFNKQKAAHHSFGLEQHNISSNTEKTDRGLHFWQNEHGLYCGDKQLVSIDKLKFKQTHHLLNTQVVLICASLLNLEQTLVYQSISQYEGLDHRFQFVLKNQYSTWIDDSKATNTGASEAAIKSASDPDSAIVLIAGGDSKGANIDSLLQTIEQSVQYLILMGKDKEMFHQTRVSFENAETMKDAVKKAHNAAKSLYEEQNKHVVVLLSPACASIDMFANYKQRGLEFCQQVKQEVSA